MINLKCCAVFFVAMSATLTQAQTQITQESWGALADGTPITRYTMTNTAGARASFMEQGAAILSIEAPDSNGKLADVVLGFDNAQDYQTGNSAYFGLTVGRYASRLGSRQLTVDGQTFQLDSQPGRDGAPNPIVLHGGLMVSAIACGRLNR